MPRPRRTRRGRRSTLRLQPWQIFSLCEHDGLDDLLGPWSGGDEERLEAWHIHGQTLIEWWAQPPGSEWPVCCLGDPGMEPAGAFFRPYGWWETAPEPRRCLACDGTLPVPGWNPHAATCHCDYDRVAESCAAYLLRLNLLLPGEQPTAADLEPEYIRSIIELGDDGQRFIVNRVFRDGKLQAKARRTGSLEEDIRVSSESLKFFHWLGDGVRPRQPAPFTDLSTATKTPSEGDGQP